MKQALGPFAVAVAASLLVPVRPPASAQPPTPRHAEGLTAIAVEIPVQVVDKRGAPVRGLTAESFELYEGRRKLTLTDFEVVDLDPASAAGGRSAAPLPARRHFLLLFDLSFSEPARLTRARHAARELVENRLHPSDLVAVATHGWQTGTRWVLGFTSDRRQIATAIEDLGLRNPMEWTLDPLGLMRVERAGGRAESFTDSVFLDRLGDLDVMVERSRRGINRAHAVEMIEGYRALAERLRWVPGRKHVVLFSQGFDGQLILGTDNPRRQAQMSEAAASGQPWLVDSEERFGMTSVLDRLEDLLETFRRADASVHAIDITGILADPEDIMGRPRGEDSLFVLADGTGGELYRNFNDAGAAMQQLLDRTSVTYLLTFQPEDLPLDGKFRSVKVRLVGGPRDLRLVHRPGYYAPMPFGEQSAEARQLAAAELVMGGEVGGPIPVSALAAPFRGSGELARVPLLVEIGGQALVSGEVDAPAALVDLYAYAFDADRQVRDFVSQEMGLDLSSLGPALLQRGLKFVGHLELPQGRYTIRVLVRDLATGRATIEETSVVVPDPAARQPTLLPPLFPDTPPDWLLVRAHPRPGSPAGGASPFLLDGRSFVPSSRPVIAPGGQAELVLMAYDAGVATRRLEGRILGPDGSVVEPAKLERLRTASAGDAGLEVVTARFRAIGLRAGHYTLEVSLVDPETGAALTSSIPLLVDASARREKESVQVASRRMP